jgi:alkylation response protein AidB-like acyl-CoA dehydrogenase
MTCGDIIYALPKPGTISILMSMSYLAPTVTPDNADLTSFASAFDRWLSDRPTSLVMAAAPPMSTGHQMEAMRNLVGDLYASGWSRHGWPESFGGLGGSILHRAVMWEGLARHGVSAMAAFEHLEILGPTLLAMGPPDLAAETFPRFLDGTETWAQGFSEPDAGSDLATLTTRATSGDNGYRITGHKIWTSWARYARWCLVLARTGTPESRHRGITAFVVDMQSAGIEVRSIPQANGRDELAEVVLDEVYVPADRIVGSLDGGWKVAMHILSHERGTFAWFRQCFLVSILYGQLGTGTADTDTLLGETVLDLASVRAMSLAGLHTHEKGDTLGPRAAFTKLLLCAAEQRLYDWALASDPDIALDPLDGRGSELHAAYLFSRIVTVYGGSQQMQLETVAKHVLKLP